MLSLRIWLHRCTSARAFPGLVAIVVVAIHARSGWQFEWDWAFNNASSSTFLLTPLAAGLTAFDRSRRMAPTLADLGATTPRGSAGLVSLALASWLWHVAAWAVGMVYVAVRVSRNGAVGTPDPWIFVEAPAVLLAGAFLGLLWGTVVTNLAAGPVAAITTYLAGILGPDVGLSGVLTAGGSTGTLMTIERTPPLAAGDVAVHLTLALTCGAWAVQRAAPRQWRSRAMLGAAGLLLIVATGSLWTVARDHDAYQLRAGAPTCVGTRVVVCGPDRARPLLDIAHTSLRSALQKLDHQGIAWQTRYLMPRGARSVPANTGVLRLSPDVINDGRLAPGALAGTLATPRMCRAYVANRDDGLLDDQATVMQWVRRALAGNEAPAIAPPAVKNAYRHLAQCDPLNPEPAR